MTLSSHAQPSLTPQSATTPSWLSRLAALVYDFLLAVSILIVGTLLYLMVYQLVTGSTEIRHGDPFLRTYLLALLYIFFAGFWVYGGATLGMRAWKLSLIDSAGRRPSLSQASIRFLLAILSWLLGGGGFLWALVDRERRTLHDRLSGTWLIKRNDHRQRTAD